MSALKEIYRYHEITKHRLNAYAPAPGFLDWDSQPNPFRRYDDCEEILLPIVDHPAESTDWNEENIARFLGLSMGLSGWKVMGPDRWSLRMTPSSGNLHPTECYLASFLEGRLYHYNVLNHSLELRASDMCGDHDGAFGAVGLSSITWREEWKYGERAYRYCQLDVGHAIGTMLYSAHLLGWTVTPLLDLSDDQLSGFLGLNQLEDFDGVEQEEPDILLLIGPKGCGVKEPLFFQNWYGKPNKLSPEKVAWPEICRLKKYVEKQAHMSAKTVDVQPDWMSDRQKAISFIQNRRSAQRMLKEDSVIGYDDFKRMLENLKTVQLFDPAISLVFFIHNVEGLAPGLYFYERKDGHQDEISHLCAVDFSWQPEGKIAGLYQLQTNVDVRKIASQLSCHQGIAGHGAFAVSMLADFKVMDEWGAWVYRRLHWEAGLLGQALYLEAEACGLNGTGIGCFFDDEVHGLLGLSTTEGPWQVIYHFTVGKARIDPRLQDEPAFSHLSYR
ncbi:MAG: SagB/ThcOx family dehydrogenase [Methylocystaceae bacterium]|nr:SagB/ThcOx family dehydrogenase [Methylocystaceae bacterium]